MRHILTPQSPPAQLTLRAHAPAPAQVQLVFQRPAQRAGRALLCLFLFWGAAPLLMLVPPHYPWALGSLVAGLYLAHRQWTGRYRVLAFRGNCPRCGRPLHLSIGSKINVPHVLTCFGCHHEPVLEALVRLPGPLTSPGFVHRHAECTGRWEAERSVVPPLLVCRACGARHPATAETLHRADEENEHGRLLAQLADEGRSLL